MSSTKKVLIGVAVVVAFLALMAIASYNGLVNAQVKSDQALANVEATYQRRADLIPQLVNTARGYAMHEEGIFQDMTDANKAFAEAKVSGDPGSMAEAVEQIDGSLVNFVALAQDYPELQAAQVFTELMDQLEGTENRINYARQEYNSVTAEYNRACRSFPSNIFAGMFGFEQRPLFKSAPGADAAPEVDFSDLG
ncbi:MAG: LemA family protein [Candidatus Nomurabacteria bacterium]|jgi:LemA protein|nr:LemA family protein [Candidatus Nomurabacteria bacterium]